MHDGRASRRRGGCAADATIGGEEFGDRGASFRARFLYRGCGGYDGPRSDRDLTRGLIERIVSGERGAMLRSQVVSWHPGVSRDEVDEAFQEACLLAGRSCRGQTEGEVYTWLRTTTHRELGHMRRRSRSRRSASF